MHAKVQGDQNIVTFATSFYSRVDDNNDCGTDMISTGEGIFGRYGGHLLLKQQLTLAVLLLRKRQLERIRDYLIKKEQGEEVMEDESPKKDEANDERVAK